MERTNKHGVLPSSEDRAANLLSVKLLDVKCLINGAFGRSMFGTKLAGHGNHGLDV